MRTRAQIFTVNFGFFVIRNRAHLNRSIRIVVLKYELWANYYLTHRCFHRIYLLVRVQQAMSSRKKDNVGCSGLMKGNLLSWILNISALCDLGPVIHL